MASSSPATDHQASPEASATSTTTFSQQPHHNVALLQRQQQQQQQQQELVKLLTQHFHHQFYHMAAAAANHHHHQQQPNMMRPAASYQQARAAHYQGAAAATPPTVAAPLFGGFDLSAAATAVDPAVGQQQQQPQHNQRSQTSNSNNNNNNQGAPKNTGVDYSLQNAGPYRPLNAIPDGPLNLFSALGNLTGNNHLALTLQQQHQAALLQQAVANPLFRPELFANHLTAPQHQHQHQQPPLPPPPKEEPARGRPAARRLSSCAQQEARQPADVGDASKGLLKFSINTILGRNQSPHSAKPPVDSIELIKQHLEQQQQQQQSHQKLRESSIKREDGDNDDDDETSSDTSISSINTSSTPQPQQQQQQQQQQLHQQLQLPHQGGQSILFSHSANNNNNPSLAPSANQPMQAIAQLHRQQAHQLPFLNAGPPPPAFPWTVAARGKPRRGMMRRAVFSDSQRVGLERRFQLQKYISKPDRKKLAEKLGLRDSQVKIWFQNRRMKWRNSKERELLSAGGSREQTLPTRNNPNPDLSDVGETIKRLTTTATTVTSATTTPVVATSPPIALNK